MSQKKFSSWCCQECGEPIGWLGRFFSFILPGRWHKCDDIYQDKDNWGV
jgi:hypothetical protein